MLTMILAAAMLIAFAVTLLCVPVVRVIAVRHGWMDFPDKDRKGHQRPTPNIGGIAVAVGFSMGLMFLVMIRGVADVTLDGSFAVILVGGLVMVLTGLYDDIRGISIKRKFLIQITVAYALLLAGYRIDLSGVAVLSGDPFSEALVSVPLTLIWIVGIINAVNLLDGLDGLASGVALIAFSCLAIIFAQNGGPVVLTAFALLMMGATAGFLIYNYTPASIFLGDSGSLFIGYMLAVYSLIGPTNVDPMLAVMIPAVVLGLPVLDTSLCMIRRMIAGRSPYSPDNDHIHHRLERLLSHKKAVLVLYAVSFWFSIAALLMSGYSARLGYIIAGVTILAAYVGVRTLGYLDVNLVPLRRFGKMRQLSLDLRPSKLHRAKAARRFRHAHHPEEMGPSRTLPVAFERQRIPRMWDSGMGDGAESLVDPDEQIVVRPTTGETVSKHNGRGDRHTNGSD